MDELIRKFSLSLARSTGRRGFLAGVARGTVGLGLLLGGVFGAPPEAFADSNCSNYEKTDYPDSCGNSSANYCSSGDGSGCYDGDDNVTYCSGCPSDDASGCPSGHTKGGQWSCCCSNKISTCQDCYDSSSNLCICKTTDRGDC